MRKVLPAVVVIAMLLNACAPAPQQISEPDRKAVKRATIDARVTKPPEPFYLGPGGAFGLMFGAIGAVATEPARADSRAGLAAFVEKAGVSIERIVLEEFTAALRSSGKLPLAESAEPGSARL